MKSYNGFTPAQRMAGDKLIKIAIEEGTLKPLDNVSCEWCGQDKGIRHYHCEDYSPENVVADAKPICWRCHMILHSKNRCPDKVKEYFDEINAGFRGWKPVYHHDFKILERDHGIV